MDSTYKMTAAEYRLAMSKKYANRYRQGSANELTRTIIQWMNWNGFVVWRNNTMGVFDAAAAAKKILALIKAAIATKKLPTLPEIKAVLSRGYRKSHERKGVADIIGYQKKTGRFVSIEVKHGKDSISPDQKSFLEQARKNSGIAIVARDMNAFLSEIEPYLNQISPQKPVS